MVRLRDVDDEGYVVGVEILVFLNHPDERVLLQKDSVRIPLPITPFHIIENDRSLLGADYSWYSQEFLLMLLREGVAR